MKGGNVPILTYSHLKINSKVLNAQNNHFIASTMLCKDFHFQPELPPKFTKIFPKFRFLSNSFQVFSRKCFQVFLLASIHENYFVTFLLINHTEPGYLKMHRRHCVSHQDSRDLCVLRSARLCRYRNLIFEFSYPGNSRNRVAL